MSILTFAKIAIDQGAGATTFTRQDFEAEIAKRAEATRKAGETPQQAYTRVMTTTEEGRFLFKASKVAPSAAPKEIEKAAPKPLGPAQTQLEKLARERARETGLSYSVAYSKLMLDPDNSELARRVMAEERAAAGAS